MTYDKGTFTEHLEELRSRLIKCIIAILIAFLCSYYFSEDLFALLSYPLNKVLPEESKLIFTGLTDAFFTYFKVALIFGIFLSSPVILYQIYMFITPGLYANEKKYLIPFVFFSSILFIGGALFGYLVIFPIGFKFFLSFATDEITALPSIKEYLTFSSKLLFSFGIIFELPLFTFFLTKLGLINYEQLSKNRRYAILLIFVSSAILTPPDVVTQILMSGPLLILFEISVIITRIFGKKQ